jgi:hypothetical protein
MRLGPAHVHEAQRHVTRNGLSVYTQRLTAPLPLHRLKRRGSSASKRMKLSPPGSSCPVSPGREGPRRRSPTRAPPAMGAAPEGEAGASGKPAESGNAAAPAQPPASPRVAAAAPEGEAAAEPLCNGDASKQVPGKAKELRDEKVQQQEDGQQQQQQQQQGKEDPQQRPDSRKGQEKEPQQPAGAASAGKGGGDDEEEGGGSFPSYVSALVQLLEVDSPSQLDAELVGCNPWAGFRGAWGAMGPSCMRISTGNFPTTVQPQTTPSPTLAMQPGTTPQPHAKTPPQPRPAAARCRTSSPL